MSSCESYEREREREKGKGESERCEKEPDAAVSLLIWSDLRDLV